ncbi:MAG: SusC/RagA family TonB-linked outer membrane protein [Gemmatimonadota bacterium]|nr:SusC/RagA family TonB-linked outer membrane protein [Gemmatimonadota bacterium]
MKRRLITVGLFAACALVLSTSGAAAQGTTGRISGTITGTESKLPIQGVRVTLLGTQQTVTTNPQGRYTLTNIAPGMWRIRTSAIGYTPVVIDSIPVSAGQTADADISLKHQTVQLEQIVVTGYGSLAKRDVTGAIGQVSAQEIKQEPVTNAIEAIKGRIAGVDIVSTGNKPGDGVRVRIRGQRSLKASNDPLYVLDGIPMAGGIGDLNPADIQSIEVLKDASATAIYGSRGANGVVLVTSTKGQAGNTRTTYDTYVGAQTVLRRVETFGPGVTGPGTYADYKREAYRNPNDVAAGGTPLYKCAGVVSQSVCPEGDAVTFYSEEIAAMKNATYTDWQNLITRQGSQVSHQLSITGGNDRNQFAVSGNLLKQIGVTLSQDYDRKSMRVNYEGQARERFRAGGSALLVRSLQRLGRGDGLYGEAIADTPLSVPYDSLGNIVFKPTPDAQRDNPLSDTQNYLNDNQRTRVFGTLFATVNLADGLDYRANFGPDLTFNRNGSFVGAQTQQQQGAGTVQSIRDQKTFDFTLDNLLTYKKALGSAHKVDATLLYSIEKQSFEENYGQTKDLPYESALYYNLGAGNTVSGLSSQISQWALQSYMARLNYTLLDKYLLTVTTRVDGSSRLAEGNKYATFPSVALGWRVLDDAAGQKMGPLSSLKLRGSYGTTGNTSVNPYQTQGDLSRTPYSFGSTAAFGYRPGSLANPELRWEKTSTVDGGADFGLMDGRLSGTFDYYRANTTDLLLDRALPPSTGYSSITQNVGATRNTGVELGLSAITLDGWHGLRWTNDITFAHNKNEIVSLNGGAVDDPGNNWYIGLPINGGGNSLWRDYQFNGIWQTADAALAASYGRKPGEIRIVDQDTAGCTSPGTCGDGKFNTNDKIILGNTYPVWTGGLSSRMDYRNFDLSFQAITRQNFLLRNDLIRGASLAGRYNSPLEDYWTPSNPSNTAPRPDKNTESPFFSESRGYQDGSFVKIRNITLGGRVPERYISRIGAQSLRLYVTAQDPFLFASSTVLDPESQTGSGVPSYRTFLLGGSFGF